MSLRSSVSTFKFLAIAAALAGPGLASAQVAPPYPVGTNPTGIGCGVQTLANYIANYSGNTGCGIGIATFYGFSASSGAPITGLRLTPGSFATGNALFAGFGFDALPGGPNPFALGASYSFEYYVDPPIDILGFVLDDAPFTTGTSVSESVCVGAPFGSGCPTGTITRTITSTNQTASATFGAPTRFIDVLTTVTIGPNAPGEGQSPVTGFSQSFQVQRVTDVPEPHEWALTGIGGLALLGAMRARGRNRKTG